MRNNISNERDKIFGNFKQYNNLIPKKNSILNPVRDNYEKNRNILDILKELNLKEIQYYDALSISNGYELQSDLKCQSNACLILNF